METVIIPTYNSHCEQITLLLKAGYTIHSILPVMSYDPYAKTQVTKHFIAFLVKMPSETK